MNLGIDVNSLIVIDAETGMVYPLGVSGLARYSRKQSECITALNRDLILTDKRESCYRTQLDSVLRYPGPGSTFIGTKCEE